MTARRLASVEEVIGDRPLVSFSIGPGGEILALTGAPEAYRAHVWTLDRLWGVDLEPIRQPLDHLQPFEDGFLAVRTRAAGKDDVNAHVFDADGTWLRGFHAGCYVQDVQTTIRGAIWVSYFDQGIDGALWPSSEGLARLDRDGLQTWGFNRQAGPSLDISDCYALNVVGERDVWLSYYMDFPLVHLRDGAVKSVWTETPVKGAHALAVSGARVASVGGYDSHESVCVWEPFVPKPPVRYTVLDESGAPLESRRARARGARIVWLTDGALYEITLDELG